MTISLRYKLYSPLKTVQVDVRTIHGSTPLCHACAAGSIESVKLLVDHGASVNPSLTALTASPLHEACIRGEIARRGNALCLDCFCFLMISVQVTQSV